MPRPLIAGNWKMYKTIREAVEFVEAFKPLVAAATHCDIVLAPTFTALRAVADAVNATNVEVSSQDVAVETRQGAFTGEVSGLMLADAGAAYAIIGHSERRQYYGETDILVNKKVFATLDAGLEPIVCVGESLDQRDAGRAESVVETQLTAGLAGLTREQASHIIIAYEPVWAIGTGRTATPEIAQQMHSFIRSHAGQLFGQETSQSIRILYGGSVKPDNIANLMSEPDIDGALVGGASLDPASFAKIVNY